MPELICEKCGTDHPVWFAHNDQWNAVTKDAGEHFLCPTCFTKLEQIRCGKVRIWKLVEDVPMDVEAMQTVLDSIPISNRPHPFRDSGVLLNIDCYTCERPKEDSIHRI